MKVLTALCLTLATSALAEIPINQSAFDKASGVVLATEDEALRLTWPVEREGSRAELTLSLAFESPLIRSLDIAGPGESTALPALRDAEPEFLVTVGSRNLDPRHGWVKFFDKVHTRPHETFRAKLDPRSARVASNGRSATVILDGLTAGSFSGELRYTVYPGTRLVHMEAVLSTEDKFERRTRADLSGGSDPRYRKFPRHDGGGGDWMVGPLQGKLKAYTHLLSELAGVEDMTELAAEGTASSS